MTRTIHIGIIAGLLLMLTISCHAVASTKSAEAVTVPQWDDKGYIMYCPCMGRFGNQMDQFLGMLRWAKTLDRTLILPPIIEYHGYTRRMPRFSQYFKIAPLRRYHRVIELHQFIHYFNNTYTKSTDGTITSSPWPVDQRTSLCYPDHGETKPSSTDGVRCNYRRGQPSNDFWDQYGLWFAKSEHFSYSLHDQRWTTDMSSSRLPVLVLGSAITPYPVSSSDRELQQYLRWNHKIAENAETFIEQYLSSPYIAIHLRNGQDWQQACRQGVGEASFMASPQCIAPGQKITHALCLPDTKLVISTVKRAVKKYKARGLFIATDHNDLRHALEASFPELRIAPVVPPLEDLSDVQEVQSATLDLAIMAQANYFIGNCVSSFTAFVKRERDIKALPSGFFGYKAPKKTNINPEAHTDKTDL